VVVVGVGDGLVLGLVKADNGRTSGSRFSTSVRSANGLIVGTGGTGSAKGSSRAGLSTERGMAGVPHAPVASDRGRWTNDPGLGGGSRGFETARRARRRRRYKKSRQTATMINSPAPAITAATMISARGTPVEAAPVAFPAPLVLDGAVSSVLIVGAAEDGSKPDGFPTRGPLAGGLCFGEC